jgi:peroxiredoxin
MKWLRNIFGGPRMATLKAGTLAPDFTLPTMDGKKFSLRDALARGPVLAAFFKVSCPTCQYTFPFLERIHKAHGNKNVTIVGVSQNEKKDTASFLKEYGVTFPVLLDDTHTFPASNAYGLTNVPSIFWIAQDGEIEISSVGWDRQEIEDMSRKAAETTGDRAKSIFQPGENVADFRAG